MIKVLFVGGTGRISAACSRLAVERGMELYLLNRGQTDRPVPAGAHHLTGDIRDSESARRALGDHRFDAVVNWVLFTPEQIAADLDLFRGRTQQYLFISSASAYQTPPAILPVTESTPLDNPYWAYSRAKIACEERLVRAYRQEKFPMTIVRPSHTYDQTMLPFRGGYTVLGRMQQGKQVVIQGDGTSLWTLTHQRDFAKGLVGLLGNARAIGEAFHITSDEWLTWNQIALSLGQALGVTPRLIHIPSDFIAAFDADLGASLLGDKAHSMIFDNTKIKRAVPDYTATIPFSQGAREIVAWYLADPARQQVDATLDQRLDAIISAYENAWPR